MLKTANKNNFQLLVQMNSVYKYMYEEIRRGYELEMSKMHVDILKICFKK